VLEQGIVVSTDLSVEGVHFRRSWITDEEIGYRAVAAALSDLAAMAAEPLGLLVSVAAPTEGGVELPAIQSGIRAATAAVGAVVLGGDLSRSPGPVLVDVTVIGRSDRPVLRSGARPGDEVWVTGRLGAAAAAVRAWESGHEPDPGPRQAFARPMPRIAESRWLAEGEIAHALIDLSDGLAGDVGHLSAASAVRIVLEAELIPVYETATGKPTGGLDLALHGGEDYELCFTAAPGLAEANADAFLESFGVRLTRVGRVEEGSGVWLRRDGEVGPLGRGGYDHMDGTR
jgi:thiamine-monophosphate kinase